MYKNSRELPQLTSSVIGGTIIKLDAGAFRRAFAPSVESIEIDGNITDIGLYAFDTYQYSNINNISIGSAENPSKLTLSSVDVPAF
jgi:hypothetical protein